MTLNLLQILKYVQLIWSKDENHSKVKFAQKYLSHKEKVHNAKLFKDSTFKMIDKQPWLKF